MVAAVGDNCIDVYAELDLAYPTGNAADVAIQLRELGVATSFVGFAGDDHYGDWIADTLAAEGLDLSHFGRLPGPTAIAELSLDGVECIHRRYHEGVSADVRYSPRADRVRRRSRSRAQRTLGPSRREPARDPSRWGED